MAHKVHYRPYPDWPSLFWARAADSYLGNDLVCRRCGGSGLAAGTNADLFALSVEQAVCRVCQGSGLLIPRRHVPDGIAGLLATAEDRLAWTCVASDQLAWPQPFIWVLERARVPIRDVDYADEDKVAFMICGDVAVGLFRITPNSGCHLELVFRMACGEEAERPAFVMPTLVC
jgi:hypothetical protein